MNTVKRKTSESFDALYRRFQRRIQQGGLVKEVRRRRYNDSVPNRNATRGKKVRGMAIAVKRQWLIRTGKAVEADFRKKRKGR